MKNYPVLSTAGYVGAELDNVGVQCLKLNTSECAGASSVTLMSANTVFADVADTHNYVIMPGGTVSPIDNQAWGAAGVTPGVWADIWGDMGQTYAHNYAGHSAAQIAPGVMPRVTSETGWYMPVGNTTAMNIGAKMILNVYLSQFKQGYKYTFIYQIGDCTYYVDQFGLYSCTGTPSSSSATPKLAATYIHNLTTVLNDNKSVATTPGALNYSIPGEPATVHDLLLQKSTGAFELVVWDEHAPVGTPPTDNVTVNLGGTHGTVNVYDPTVGTGVVQTRANVSSVPLTLSDHPMIIEVVN